MADQNFTKNLQKRIVMYSADGMLLMGFVVALAGILPLSSQLRRAEQKYRRIFENASEGIFQSTPDGKLIAANPALALMYGFDSQQEIIRSCDDISRTYVDSARRQEFKDLLEQNGVVRDFEYQAYRKDGSKFELHRIEGNAGFLRQAVRVEIDHLCARLSRTRAC